MKSRMMLAVLALSIGAAHAQPPVQMGPRVMTETEQDAEREHVAEKNRLARRSPYTLLESFAAAIDDADLERAASGVWNAKSDVELGRLQKTLSARSVHWKLEMTPLFPAGQTGAEGETITVRVVTALRVGDTLLDRELPQVLSRFESVDLRREGEEWKIVPRSKPLAPATTSRGLTGAENLKTLDGDALKKAAQELVSRQERQQAAMENAASAARDENDGVINQWARLVSQRGSTAHLTREISLDKAHRVAMAVAGLAQDYDRFNFDADNVYEMLSPYLESGEVINAYTVNPALFGKPLADVGKILPSRTPAIYESGNGPHGLDYRFDGQAIVGFTDGHVELVTPEEVDKLVWRPVPPSR